MRRGPARGVLAGVSLGCHGAGACALVARRSERQGSHSGLRGRDRALHRSGAHGGLDRLAAGSGLGVGGRSPHLPGFDDRELAERLLYTPTVNIPSMGAGDLRDRDRGGHRGCARQRRYPPRAGAGAGANRRARATAPRRARVRPRRDRRAASAPAGAKSDRNTARAGSDRRGRRDDGRSRCLSAAAGSRPCAVGARHPRRDHRFAGGHDATCERYSCARRAWWIDSYLDHVRFSYRLLERLAAEVATAETER